MQDLTCQELVELVTAYLDSSLNPQDKIRFEEHLGFCTGCTHYFAQMERTVRLLNNVAMPSMQFEARMNLLQEFRAWYRDSVQAFNDSSPNQS